MRSDVGVVPGVGVYIYVYNHKWFVCCFGGGTCTHKDIMTLLAQVRSTSNSERRSNKT